MKRAVIVVAITATLLAGTRTWIAAQPQRQSIATEDFVELQRLLWTNHIGYDFADRDNGDLWLSTFAKGAVLDSGAGPSLTGDAAIRDFALAPLKSNPKRRFRHWTSTFYATPHPEGATLIAFFLAVMNNGPNNMMQMATTGYYESIAVKTADGWKLKHHVVHQEGNMTVPH